MCGLYLYYSTTFSDEDVTRLRGEISRRTMREQRSEDSIIERQNEPDVPTRGLHGYLILVKE